MIIWGKVLVLALLAVVHIGSDGGGDDAILAVVRAFIVLAVACWQW